MWFSLYIPCLWRSQKLEASLIFELFSLCSFIWCLQVCSFALALDGYLRLSCPASFSCRRRLCRCCPCEDWKNCSVSREVIIVLEDKSWVTHNIYFYLIDHWFLVCYWVWNLFCLQPKRDALLCSSRSLCSCVDVALAIICVLTLTSYDSVLKNFNFKWCNS